VYEGAILSLYMCQAPVRLYNMLAQHRSIAQQGLGMRCSACSALEFFESTAYLPRVNTRGQSRSRDGNGRVCYTSRTMAWRTYRCQ
jgi:hypothetical protein